MHLAPFFDAAPDPFLIIDADKRIFRINAAWEQLYGWSRKDLEGTPWVLVVHHDDAAYTDEAIARKVPSVFRVRVRRRQGDYRVTEWSWIQWQDELSIAVGRLILDYGGPHAAADA
jgi:PAS domain S-box-containing protein